MDGLTKDITWNAMPLKDIEKWLKRCSRAKKPEYSMKVMFQCLRYSLQCENIQRPLKTKGSSFYHGKAITKTFIKKRLRQTLDIKF